MISGGKFCHKMTSSILLAVLSVLPILTMQQCLTNDDTKAVTDPHARLTLFRGEQEFTLAMLQQINSMKPQSNIFFSPYSIHQAMVLAYFSSANHTEAEIKRGIFLPKTQDKLSTMQAYRLEKFFQSMRAINDTSGYQFTSANRLYVSQEQNVKECMEELFKDEIEKINFKKSHEAATQINNWVSNQTKGQIDKLIPENQLSEDSKLVLTNAAYFKGLWKSKFDKEKSKKELFYISSSKNAFVTMMKTLDTFNYAVSETLGAHVLEMPYVGEDISMFVLLPPFASPNGITNVLKRLTLKTLHEIIDGDIMAPRQIHVHFPKFTVEQSIELPEVLQSLGMDIFNAKADFSSLTNDSTVSFNDAIHKAKIQVDEDGTVAAAATALFTFRSSRPLDPVQFICNHPFIYFIYDRVSQTILFVGIYNTPDSKAS